MLIIIPLLSRWGLAQLLLSSLIHITFLWHFQSLDPLSMLPTKSGMPASLLLIFIHMCAFNLLPSLTFFMFTLLAKFCAGSRAQLRPTRKQNMLPVAGINILQWDFRLSMQWLRTFLWHCAARYLYSVAYREGVWGVQTPPPPEIPKISVESSIAWARRTSVSISFCSSLCSHTVVIY